MAAVLQLERNLRHRVMTKAWRGRRPAPRPQPVAPATPKLAQEVAPAALGQRALDWRQREVLKQQTPQEPEQRRRSSRQAGKRGCMIVIRAGSQGPGRNLTLNFTFCSACKALRAVVCAVLCKSWQAASK